MMTPTMRRRRVVSVVGGAIAVGVAGCLALGDRENSIEQDDSTGIPGEPTGYATVDIRADPWFKFEPNLVHLHRGGLSRGRSSTTIDTPSLRIIQKRTPISGFLTMQSPGTAAISAKE